MKTEQKNRSSVIKNIFLAVLAAATVVVSVVAFNQYSQKQEAKESLSEFKQEAEARMKGAFNRIGENLAAIGQHEGTIQQAFDATSDEGIENPEEMIQREIEKIETLIAENEAIINDLNMQVEDRDHRLAEYDKTVNNLNVRLAEYRDEVSQLVAEKEALGRNLEQAKTDNQNMKVVLASKQEELKLQHEVIKQQKEVLEEQEKVLHTAFYVMGDFKELREAGVMEKEGGIIGIAASKEVKDDFAKEEFVEIDIRHTPLIPVFSKDAELASNHPSGSYEWVKGEGNPHWLKITNPEKFWESTKYMVILTKGDLDQKDIARAE